MIAADIFSRATAKKPVRQSGINTTFIQDNQAKSVYGVVRGLHYQKDPFAQTKFIRALQGSILDVVVDIRKGSPTYGEHLFN
ncbi:MAG: dTDP-4-dehydrorhamnose 3,5-epimerase family protein [Ferruginibacter sp.]